MMPFFKLEQIQSFSETRSLSHFHSDLHSWEVEMNIQKVLHNIIYLTSSTFIASGIYWWLWILKSVTYD